MFYSHEILTRREHGVATIWLVATLGSKSSLKRVTRKAINDVDVPKAVQTIVSPDAPMALRLQGNLLYGVSRVYSQQCNYVHSDLQSFWDKLRQKSLVFGREGMEIDPDAGRARPDQLNLQDDPAFLPDFDINLDLSLFDLPLERSLSRGTGQLPLLAGSSRASLSDHEPQLELPSDETPVSGIGGFDLGGGTSSVGHYGSNLRARSMFEEPGIINDPEFDIDADGNFYTPARGQSQNEIGQAAPASLGFPGAKAADSTGITERVRAEHEAGLQGPVDDPSFDFEDQGMYMGDDEPQLPDAAQFSARHASSAPPEQHRQTSSAHPEQEVSSVSEAAPQRRIRTKPAIKVDHETQLPSSLLKSWETDYLQKMAADWRRHEHFTSTLPQSKKNAEHIVLNIGLSGLGREFDTDLDHPLRQAFGGQALFDLLLGKESSPVGKKRGHASDEDNEDDEEGRRVRPRSDDEPELGRGEDGQFQFDDGDGIFAQGNDDPPIEVGRNAPPSIPDIDSIRNSMPWNILSSRAGSARPTGLTSSAGPLPGGFEPAFGPPSLRSHRLTSASPLFGRGTQGTTRYSSLEIPGPTHHTSGELGTFDDNGFQLPPDDIEDEEFQLHGPAAGVSTQQANNSQWLASTLEDKANNFFAFLQAKIDRRFALVGQKPEEARQLGLDEDEDVDVDVDLDVQETRKQTVTFDDLLPPDRNSAVVAAQGLLHVLTLVTRGAVNVNQEEDFGEIKMSVVPGVRLVEREVVNNDDNHEVEQGIEGINLDDFMGEEEEEASGHLDEGGDADDVDDEDMYGWAYSN